jgi:hypothetical protein
MEQVEQLSREVAPIIKAGMGKIMVAIVQINGVFQDVAEVVTFAPGQLPLFQVEDETGEWGEWITEWHRETATEPQNSPKTGQEGG